jgi:RPA family protein
MAEEFQKRQTARKLWIRDVLAGVYVKEEGVKPNHIVLADNSKAARVSIMGVVVSISSEGLPALLLDDGSGRIVVRTFEPENPLKSFQVGDVIHLIGRPRAYNNEMYVLPEIVKRISDLGWLEVRKLELARQPIASVAIAAPHSVTEEEVVDDSFSLTEQVLGAIRSLDEGPGADTEQVIGHVGARNAEKTIQFLLQNGDIFEVSPGKLKVLE